MRHWKIFRYLPGCCCFSGFFRADQLLGTISVKLQPLENECEIHDSFDVCAKQSTVLSRTEALLIPLPLPTQLQIMNGRKVVGGKVEVKLRVRNPMLNKQIENIDEKWLVIDN